MDTPKENQSTQQFGQTQDSIILEEAKKEAQKYALGLLKKTKENEECSSRC